MIKYVMLALLLAGCGRVTSDDLLDEAGKACTLERDGQKAIDTSCVFKMTMERCMKEKLDLYICGMISSMMGR